MKPSTADIVTLTRLNAGGQRRFSSFPILKKGPSMRGFFLSFFQLTGTRKGE